LSLFIDTSVLVAAMVETEAHHDRCSELLDREAIGIYSHGISETFSTLTGGRKTFRIPAGLATSMLAEDYLPGLTVKSLTPVEMLKAMQECERRGVRGGAIFDFLHLVAAKKAKATALCTLNSSHFHAFYRDGDPEIVHPA
jgi:predicted nucleic acid-binding protein